MHLAREFRGTAGCRRSSPPPPRNDSRWPSTAAAFPPAAARRKAARLGPGHSPAACGRTAARPRRGASAAGSLAGRPGRRSSVPSGSLRLRVDRPVGQVLVAPPADGVEAFQREAERIDAPMARRAAGVAGVLLDELPHGQAIGRGFILGQPRHVLRRLRQLLAEQHFADPVAAQDRTGARRARLLRQRRRQPQDAAAAVLSRRRRRAAIRARRRRECRSASPALRSRTCDRHRTGSSTEPSRWNRSVKNRIDSSYMSPRRLGELGKVPLALFVERVEVVDVQPLAGELGRQPPHARVAEHPPRLRGRARRARAACRPRPPRAARRRAATTRGSSSAGWPAPSRRPAPGPSPAALLFEPIQKRRRDEDSGQREAKRLVVRQLLLAQRAIERCAAPGLRRRSADGDRPRGELDQRVDLPAARRRPALAGTPPPDR